MKEGYKVTKLGNIPESWEVQTIGNTFKDFGDGNYSALYPNRSQFINEGVPFIRAVNITYGKIVNNGFYYIASELHNILKKGHLKYNDILISTRGDIGKVALVDKEYIGANINAQLVRIGEQKDIIDSKFFYQILLSDFCKNQFIEYQTGSALKQLPVSSLKKIKIVLPPLPEQQKIASILSTVDEKIENIDSQISQTQQLKKGLMQHLLTKGIGHAKFKISELGDIPESWEVIKLKHISKINASTLSNSTKPDYEFKYLDLSAVKSGTVQFPKDKIKFSSSPSRARRIVRKDDVIMATVRPNLLGYCIVNFNMDNFICSTGFAVITPNDDTVGMFIYQFLYSNEMQFQINKLIVGSNYPAINSSDVENLCITKPPLVEQQKIASILNTVDEKLLSLKTKKETYQQLKAGLMQQLLTGKIRVTVPIHEPSLA